MAKRKLGKLAAVWLLLASVAAGCLPNADGSAGDSANAAATGGETDRAVRIFNFKVEMAEQLSELAKRYETETGVAVEVDTCGGGCDYSAGLKTRFNSGDKPDIFFVAGYSDLELWQEYLEDLSDRPWADDIVELAKPAIVKDGKVYGMPLALEGWGFIYNKELFRKAGIPDVPKTLTQLREAAEKLEAAGIQPFENGYAEWWIIGNHLLNVAFAQQPDPSAFIDAVKSGEETLVGNPTLAEWIDLVDLTVRYGQDNALQTDYNTQVTNFAAGRAAMMQQGVWTQLQLDKLNPNLDIGFLPMPINDDAEAMDKLQIGVANYWVVLRSSRVKKEAKAFLDWLASSEAGRRFMEDAKLIPAIEGVPVAEERLGPLAADLLKALREGRTLPWMWQRYPGYEADTSRMAAQIQAYIGGSIDRKRLVREFQSIWDDWKGA